MGWLWKVVIVAFVAGLFLGACLGFWWGHGSGEQVGLAVDVNSREVMASELGAVTAKNQQQAISLQTAEASITSLTQRMDEQQRAHELEIRELELYRRIESGGEERGLHVEEIQLVDLGDAFMLRLTLLQVGARDRAQGNAGVAFIGVGLPDAVNNRLVLADPEGGTGLEFDFQYLTRLSVLLPSELTPLDPSGQAASWLEGLDLIEIDLIPEKGREKPKQVTIPADQMIVGPAE